MLKLVLTGWINYGATFNDFLPGELCRPRIMEEKHYKSKDKGEREFSKLRNLFCQIHFLKSDFQTLKIRKYHLFY